MNYVFGPTCAGCLRKHSGVCIAMYLDIYSNAYRVSQRDSGLMQIWADPAALSEVLWLLQCTDMFVFSER